MKVLIDTNVILDVLTKREPHYQSSASFLKLCGGRITGCLSASQTTDIFYMLRRSGHSPDTAKGILKNLTGHIKVLDIASADVSSALSSDMPDYEDALLAFGAKRHKAEYIVTRNEKDFLLSPVPAIAPKTLLGRLFRA